MKAPERPFSDSLQNQPKEELSSSENFSRGQQAGRMGGSFGETSLWVERGVGCTLHPDRLLQFWDRKLLRRDLTLGGEGSGVHLASRQALAVLGQGALLS